MSAKIELVGIIAIIFDEEQITERYRKRIFKLVVNNEKAPDYPDTFKIELINDFCSKINDFGLGQKVWCSCTISGNDWYDKDGKAIRDKQGEIVNSTTINCWHIRDYEYHLEKTGSNDENPDIKHDNSEPEDDGSVIYPGDIDVMKELPALDNIEPKELFDDSDDLPF